MEVYKYDIALSFAGEDRIFVDKIANILKAASIKVFYDKFEEVDLWGKDLVQHFEYVYSKSSLYCVPFLSEHYKAKMWTKYEIKNAISRAIKSKIEYILPVKFENIEIEGINDAISYLTSNYKNHEEIASRIIAKVQLFKNEKISKDQESGINVTLPRIQSGFNQYIHKKILKEIYSHFIWPFSEIFRKLIIVKHENSEEFRLKYKFTSYGFNEDIISLLKFIKYEHDVPKPDVSPNNTYCKLFRNSAKLSLSNLKRLLCSYSNYINPFILIELENFFETIFLHRVLRLQENYVQDSTKYIYYLFHPHIHELNEYLTSLNNIFEIIRIEINESESANFHYLIYY